MVWGGVLVLGLKVWGSGLRMVERNCIRPPCEACFLMALSPEPLKCGFEARRRGPQRPQVSDDAPSLQDTMFHFHFHRYHCHVLIYRISVYPHNPYFTQPESASALYEWVQEEYSEKPIFSMVHYWSLRRPNLHPLIVQHCMTP